MWTAAEAPSSKKEVIRSRVHIRTKGRSWQHWFGDESRPLAGWTHLPVASERDVALVLCNPFGVEMMSTRRAYRHLADTLSGAGFPVLRFDYDGTGDSAGTDEDADRLEAWISSIHAAVAEIRRISGASKIVLCGVRLGALLARAYAARHPVDGLVLIACPTTGKAHVRELRALEHLRAGRFGRPSNARGEYLAGFYMGDETQSALSQLDVRTLSLARPSDIFIVSSDDSKTNERHIEAGAAKSGAATWSSRTPGYGDMMREDPYMSVVPARLWSEVASWLCERAPVSSRPSSTLEDDPDFASAKVLAPGVLEELVAFDGMSGVVSEPASNRHSADRPTILLLNVGANHRIGSGRLYVKLARHWAARGFRVLRFDRSGIGDSGARSDAEENCVYAKHGVPDTRAAMDFLEQKTGCRRFVLAGVCSGAYFSYHTAMVDPRTVGLLIMNLLTFQWKEGDSLEVRTRKTFKSTRFYAKNVLNLETIRRAFRGEVHVAAIGRELVHRGVTSGVARVRRFASSDPILKTFRELDSRGVEVHLVFGHDDAGIDLVEKHLGLGARDMRRRSHFRMTVIDGADHTFTQAKSREALQEILTEHLRETYPPCVSAAGL